MRRQQVARAPVPSAAERRRRIEGETLPRNIAELVITASAEGGDRLVWNFFESQETLTYAQLAPRVFALAAGLMSVGVRKGTHVAVMLPNKAAFPLTWLALGTIGAVMVPVNTYIQRARDSVRDGRQPIELRRGRRNLPRSRRPGGGARRGRARGRSRYCIRRSPRGPPFP